MNAPTAARWTQRVLAAFAPLRDRWMLIDGQGLVTRAEPVNGPSAATASPRAPSRTRHPIHDKAA